MRMRMRMTEYTESSPYRFAEHTILLPCIGLWILISSCVYLPSQGQYRERWASMSIEINATDVIRIIEQYLKENNLTKTLATLQEESLISLNTVDNKDQFYHDIIKGNWDIILHTVSFLKLSEVKLVDLYEQIFLELVEMKELGVARNFLRQTPPLLFLKDNQAERYFKLEQILVSPVFDPKSTYSSNSSKEKRRVEIAQSLVKDITVVSPSRLLTLLGQAIQWQQSQGLMPLSGSIDLFKGHSGPLTVSSVDEVPVATCVNTIQFEKEFRPESAAFSPDGQYFVTGTMDGFIEIWNPQTGKLRRELSFQAEEGASLVMESAVLCLNFNKTSESLVAGSESGDVMAWKISEGGKCICAFIKAHDKGITSVSFSKDGTQILTTSYDHLVKLFGLKSGQKLKEFRGHDTFVNNALFTMDGKKILSSCSDGTIKIWDSKTTDCLMTMSPRQDMTQMSGSSLIHVPIYAILPLPTRDEFVVCCKSFVVPIISAQGVTLRVLKPTSSITPTMSATMHDKGAKLPSFMSGCLSPSGKYYSTVADDRCMYIFDLEQGNLHSKLSVSESSEIIGIVGHPLTMMVATYNLEGTVSFWN